MSNISNLTQASLPLSGGDRVLINQSTTTNTTNLSSIKKYVGNVYLNPSSDVSNLSSNWQSTYTTVQTNSADKWTGTSSVNGDITGLSGNWQNTYNQFSTTSSNFVSQGGNIVDNLLSINPYPNKNVSFKVLGSVPNRTLKINNDKTVNLGVNSDSPPNSLLNVILGTTNSSKVTIGNKNYQSEISVAFGGQTTFTSIPENGTGWTFTQGNIVLNTGTDNTIPNQIANTDNSILNRIENVKYEVANVNRKFGDEKPVEHYNNASRFSTELKTATFLMSGVQVAAHRSASWGELEYTNNGMKFNKPFFMSGGFFVRKMDPNATIRFVVGNDTEYYVDSNQPVAYADQEFTKKTGVCVEFNGSHTTGLSARVIGQRLYNSSSTTLSAKIIDTSPYYQVKSGATDSGTTWFVLENTGIGTYKLWTKFEPFGIKNTTPINVYGEPNCTIYNGPSGNSLDNVTTYGTLTGKCKLLVVSVPTVSNANVSLSTNSEFYPIVKNLKFEYI